MPLAEPYFGTQTATVGTEHVLNTTTPETTDGVYQLWIDTANMALGDTLEVRVKEKIISTGTQRTPYFITVANAQSEPILTPPLFLMHGWDMTLKQTTGTGRSYAFSIRRVS